jgi:hypothetical protein
MRLISRGSLRYQLSKRIIAVFLGSGILKREIKVTSNNIRDYIFTDMDVAASQRTVICVNSFILIETSDYTQAVIEA